MLELSNNNQIAATSDAPWPVEFIEIIPKLSDSSTYLRISNHYGNLSTTSEVTAGSSNLYIGSYNLLSISASKSDLDVKEAGVDISLSGIDTSTLSLVLSSANQIQGSKVYISRGFINKETGLLYDNSYRRWEGYVENYNIKDDNKTTEDDKIIISLKCTSNLSSLLDSTNGRNTSVPGFQRENPDDLSMEFVPALVEWAGNFYKVPESGKVVCTAMNKEFGFGSFRNAIWLKHAKDNLTDYHQVGYHWLFKDAAAHMYDEDKKDSLLTRWGADFARRRSRYLWRRAKDLACKDYRTAIESSFFEHLAYVIGRVISWKK